MKLSALRDMTDERLVEEHDSKNLYDFTPEFCRNELARREQNRQTKAMLKHTETMLNYTLQIKKLTVYVTIATFLSLGASIVSLIIAFRSCR